jgi:excisionase family DNA binding protein
MADELCTVDFAATRLKLHPKTVLRYIHEGRLKATRIGKSYRIRRADLDELAGAPPPPETPAAADPWATAIVDIPGVGAELAQTWARQVTTALGARRDSTTLVRADVVYEPARDHLKIVITGPPADVAHLMSLIRVWIEQLRV